MKKRYFLPILLVAFSFFAFTSCSKDEESTPTTETATNNITIKSGTIQLSKNNIFNSKLENGEIIVDTKPNINDITKDNFKVTLHYSDETTKIVDDYKMDIKESQRGAYNLVIVSFSYNDFSVGNVIIKSLIKAYFVMPSLTNCTYKDGSYYMNQDYTYTGSEIDPKNDIMFDNNTSLSTLLDENKIRIATYGGSLNERSTATYANNKDNEGNYDNYYFIIEPTDKDYAWKIDNNYILSLKICWTIKRQQLETPELKSQLTNGVFENYYEFYSYFFEIEETRYFIDNSSYSVTDGTNVYQINTNDYSFTINNKNYTIVPSTGNITDGEKNYPINTFVEQEYKLDYDYKGNEDKFILPNSYSKVGEYEESIDIKPNSNNTYDYEFKTGNTSMACPLIRIKPMVLDINSVEINDPTHLQADNKYHYPYSTNTDDMEPILNIENTKIETLTSKNTQFNYGTTPATIQIVFEGGIDFITIDGVQYLKNIVWNNGNKIPRVLPEIEYYIDKGETTGVDIDVDQVHFKKVEYDENLSLYQLHLTNGAYFTIDNTLYELTDYINGYQYAREVNNPTNSYMLDYDMTEFYYYFEINNVRYRLVNDSNKPYFTDGNNNYSLTSLYQSIFTDETIEYLEGLGLFTDSSVFEWDDIQNVTLHTGNNNLVINYYKDYEEASYYNPYQINVTLNINKGKLYLNPNWVDKELSSLGISDSNIEETVRNAITYKTYYDSISYKTENEATNLTNAGYYSKVATLPANNNYDYYLTDQYPMLNYYSDYYFTDGVNTFYIHESLNDYINGIVFVNDQIIDIYTGIFTFNNNRYELNYVDSNVIVKNLTNSTEYLTTKYYSFNNSNRNTIFIKPDLTKAILNGVEYNIVNDKFTIGTITYTLTYTEDTNEFSGITESYNDPITQLSTHWFISPTNILSNYSKENFYTNNSVSNSYYYEEESIPHSRVVTYDDNSLSSDALNIFNINVKTYYYDSNAWQETTSYSSVGKYKAVLTLTFKDGYLPRNYTLDFNFYLVNDKYVYEEEWNVFPNTYTLQTSDPLQDGYIGFGSNPVVSYTYNGNLQYPKVITLDGIFVEHWFDENPVYHDPNWDKSGTSSNTPTTGDNENNHDYLVWGVLKLDSTLDGFSETNITITIDSTAQTINADGTFGYSTDALHYVINMEDNN